MSRERAHLRLTAMARRRLAEDVVAQIAGDELALDFPGQVVGDIFSLPVAVGEVEVVDERAIDEDALIAAAGVDGVFGHESSADLAGAVSRRD